MDRTIKSFIPVCILLGLFFFMLVWYHASSSEVDELGIFNNVLILVYLSMGSVFTVVGLNICYEWIKEKVTIR